MAKRIGKQLVLACLTITLLVTLSGLSQGAQISGTTLNKAVKALQSPKPTPAEQKALDSAIDILTAEHFARLNLNPKTASRQQRETLNGVSRLTLKVVATVTESDPAVLQKFTLDDLMAFTGVVMSKLKEMKPSEADLQNDTYLNDTFIPAVIDAIAKSQ